MTEVDLNSDMGEGFGPWTIGDGVDAAIMPLISSANIATGFHAGDPSSMRRTVEMAAEHGVAIGAHPGFRDLVGFGRRHIAAPAIELVNDMLYQLGAPARIRPAAGPVAATRQAPRRALHAPGAGRGRRAPVRRDPATPGTGTAALLHARFGHLAHRSGTGPAAGAREFYADRDYDRSGSIVFTRRVAALDPQQVADKVLRACREGKGAHRRGRGPRHRLRLGVHPQRHPLAPWSWSPAPARGLEGAGIRIKAPR